MSETPMNHGAESSADDRQQLWQQVEKAQRDRLPQSAAKLLTTIYDSAVKDQAFDEATRALCLRIRTLGRINQPEYPYAIRQLQAEIPNLPTEIKPLAQVIQAHWFLQYYYQNQWRFAQRSQTSQTPSDDFETWDLPRLLDQIDQLLQAALAESDALKKIPIQQFDKLLLRGQLPDIYQPTVYDFLAHQATHFYALNEQVTRGQNDFELVSDSPIFATTQALLDWHPKSTDTRSPELRAIKIYQDWLRFHAEDDEPTARLDIDLQRLQFGKRAAVGEGISPRYEAALQRFADQHVDHELSSWALALKAQSLQADDKLVQAHQTASVGMKRFPDSPGGRICHNIFHAIQQPQLSIAAEQVWNGPNVELQVTHTNVAQVHFRLIPCDYRNRRWGRQQDPAAALYRPEGRKLAQQPPAASWSVDLPATPDFQQRTDSVATQSDVASGCYLLVSSLDEDFGETENLLSAATVWVSGINVVSRVNNGVAGGQVLNARSGQPITGAEVSLYRWEQAGRNSREVSLGTVKTDPQGMYRFKTGRKGNHHMVYVRHADQVFGFQDYLYANGNRTRTNQQTFFFTDRSIYRPGQTVQFKGICVSSNTNTNAYQTIANRDVSVRLTDPNGQQIETLKFRSNEFGSFAGSFTAPRDRGTGGMRLQVADGPSGQALFRVEEYKRPKFVVAVEKPSQQVRLEQAVAVKVKATAYTGAPIDGAKVTWRVVRNVRYPQWWYWRCWYQPPATPSKEIADGTGTTTADGQLMVSFEAQPDRSVPRESQPIFSYTIYADVTDTAGETRSSQQTVQVGYTSLAAELKVGDWLTADQPVKLELATKTLDGEALSAKGKLTFYRLQNPEKVQRKKLLPYYRGQRQDNSDIKSWALGQSVQTESMETADNGSATIDIRLDAGAYKAVFETADAAGQSVTAEYPFLVIDRQATAMPVRIASHLTARSWTLQPGESFEAVWGTGYSSGRAFVEIEHRGEVVMSYWTDAERTQQPIQFPIEEKHRGGLQVRLTYVRDNRAYIENRPINVPWSNKDLKIKWEHFVSKLTPGGKETWTAVISGPDAETKTAEMVAAMYDASLDAFAPHNWSNSIKSLFYYNYSETRLQHHNQLAWLRSYLQTLSTNHRTVNATYRHWDSAIVGNAVHWANAENENWSFLSRRGERLAAETGRGAFMSFGASPVLASSSVAKRLEALTRNNTALVGDFAVDEAEISAESHDGQDNLQHTANETVSLDLDQVTARKNLQETAFFFPQLTSAADGTVRIEFTVPEALTQWKFMGFAHDNDLRTALLTDQVTTSKDLMVQPNPPRFLREGDQLEFSVKVINRGDAPQTGSVRLSLANAATDQDLNASFGNTDNQQSFTIAAGQSKSFFWKLQIPDFVGVVTWKAVGATESLSDGEEGLLPVLSKRILVVESLPLPIRGKQSKTFDFAALEKIDSSDSLKSQSLTVQMTSNPSWYAVMALPYLMEYPHQCNEQVFNRLYANALGQHIVGSDPKIKRVFDQWRATPALDSPLEKNEELRNILIAETPWLREGKQESQARRNVAILFDKNRLNNELGRATQQLIQSQYSDGSWSWFPGGPANDFITMYITTGFGRLRHLGVEIDQRPAIKSLNRLDDWIHRTYLRLKADGHLNRNNLSATHCLYLYGRSFFLKDRKVADKHREAIDYFLGQAKQHWQDVGKMSQAQLAIAAKRFGDNQTPTAILKSLTERSQTSEEFGRYWQESNETWWWYRAPIETQAMLIEAYAEVADDQQAVEDCKVWLLKQKQTQNWKTTKATADAVYALLLRGTDSLASSELVQVSLGDVKIEPQDVEAGTGFYSQKFAGGDVDVSMKTIQVTKSDDGVAWGSVHWKYLEDVSKIQPHEGTSLTLKKSLYLKKNTPAGPTLIPVSGPVEVGDEVVTRVEIRVDRDMEYVHLKDQRGSGTEPVNVLSGYRRDGELWYYESTRDTASHFFIDYLPRGTHVFETSVRVQHRGRYPSGIATLQCMYAPEFNSHSNSVAIEVK